MAKYKCMIFQCRIRAECSSGGIHNNLRQLIDAEGPKNIIAIPFLPIKREQIPN